VEYSLLYVYNMILDILGRSCFLFSLGLPTLHAMCTYWNLVFRGFVYESDGVISFVGDEAV